MTDQSEPQMNLNAGPMRPTMGKAEDTASVIQPSSYSKQGASGITRNPIMGGNPRIPASGNWNKNPQQAEDYTGVFSQALTDMKTPKTYLSTHSQVPKSGSTRAGESKLPNLNTKEVMKIPYKPEMNRDPGPSIVGKKESERADDSSKNYGEHSINSAGGVPIEQSHLHHMLGGRAYDKPSPDWAQSGAGNTGYNAMDKLKEQICDFVFGKKNFGVVQKRIQVLMEEVAQVQSLLISKENDSKDEVRRWLEEAGEIVRETNGILEGPDKKHLCSSCWDPSSSWVACKILRDIESILERREGLDLSSYIIRRSYCNNLQSRENILQEMLEALMDVQINVISIYGMMGVGKTVLAKELARRALNDQFFDVVVMIEVSESADVMLIQSQIANKIGLQLNGDDEDTRAQFLYNALEEKIIERGHENDTEPVQQSKILLILDGLQHVIELGKVGIPYKEEGRASCNVVLLSRSADVCKKMGAEKQFLVECLNLEEAKLLFQERLGEKIETMEITLERYQFMENVFLVKCRGLPLVIDTLSFTLRSMSWSNWEITVDNMERHTLVEVDELKEVPHAILKLCNSFIKNGEKQKLLLLSCLIQQGMHLTTERLKRYGIGFGLFEDHSLASATQQINLWVDELKSLSILLEAKDQKNIKMRDINKYDVISAPSQDEIQFKMHDIIQEVVISALSQGDVILDVLLDAGTCWYTTEFYENCIAISVMPDGNDKCLNGLELHKLQALLLKEKPSLSLSDNFFQGMQNLRILDIYGTTFVELPSSIGNLKSLVTLHLECCEIKCISSISNLAKLEVLSLRGSSVQVSPVQIGNLTNLRVLDLSCCKGLKDLDDGVLVRLDQLSELYVYGSSIIWTNITKLSSLDLEVLEIDISPSRLSPDALHYSSLRKFLICIAYYPSLEEGNSFSHVLAFNGYGSFLLEESGLIYLLQWTEMLQIKEASGLCNGVGNLSIHGFLQLKKLHIERCFEMECIIDANKLPMSQKDIFPELQILILKDLTKLRKICCWQPSCTSFSELRELELQNLKLLHPHVLPIQLATKLRHMKVIDCSSLLFIFPKTEINGTDRIVKLPCLEKLELQNLQHLQAIQDPSNASTTVAPVLFNGKIEFPSLKDICLVNLDRIKMLWEKQPYGRDPCFRSLKSMKVVGCGNLECLFSTSIIDSLLQLEDLEITHCFRLKEVVTSHAEDDGGPSHMKTFRKLQTLKLENLMNLERFYRGSFLLEFPSLRVLALNTLYEMKTFIDPVNVNVQSFLTERTLFIEEVSFPSLEHLQLSSMNVELIQIQGHQIFPNLSSLTLKRLPHLKSTPDIKSKKLRSLCLEGIYCIKVPFSILPVNMPPILAHKLEELTLSDCKYQQELVDTVLLPSLRNLNLTGLRLLRTIPRNVLRNLRSLIIRGLNDMTSRIPTTMVAGGNVLHHLESMEVEECKGMQVIISDEWIVDEDFVIHGLTLFPSLKHIRLCMLGNLELFSRRRYEALFPSLERVQILWCDSFQSFSRGTIRTPRLTSVEFDSKTRPANTFDDLNVILSEMVAEKQSWRQRDKGLSSWNSKPNTSKISRRLEQAELI